MAAVPLLSGDLSYAFNAQVVSLMTPDLTEKERVVILVCKQENYTVMTCVTFFKYFPMKITSSFFSGSHQNSSAAGVVSAIIPAASAAAVVLNSSDGSGWRDGSADGHGIDETVVIARPQGNHWQRIPPVRLSHFRGSTYISISDMCMYVCMCLCVCVCLYLFISQTHTNMGWFVWLQDGLSTEGTPIDSTYTFTLHTNIG